MGKGFQSGASLIAIGIILRKFLPGIASMSVGTNICSDMNLSKMFIVLGAIVIGAEVFKMAR